MDNFKNKSLPVLFCLQNVMYYITVCDHYDTTVTDSKGHKSCLPTQERRMQDQSPALHGWLEAIWTVLARV